MGNLASESMHPITPPSRKRLIVEGMWRFTLVSVAGFAPWVISDGWFGRHVSEQLLYVMCLLAFVVAALVLLPGMLSAPGQIRRTTIYFIPSFTAYALLWCACWFVLHGRLGEWCGVLSGGVAFTLFAGRLLAPRWPALTVVVVVVLCQALGYFAGGGAMAATAGGQHPGAFGMLLWALCYGIGFGAGLGWLVASARPR